MKNVAYKTMQNNPNIPNGFIIDHFETDDDIVEGYTVVDKSVFSQLLANNITLMRIHETNKNVVGADPNQPTHFQRPNHEAEPASVSILTERNKEIKQSQDDMALFKQFLEWKKSQDSGS